MGGGRSKRKSLPFREGLFYFSPSGEEPPYLIGSRCENCGRTFFPKRAICCQCFRDDTMKEAVLSNRGKLYNYCLSQIAPPGFKPPYALGYVDLPEGIRLFSLLSLDSPSEKSLELGMDVELVIDKMKEDEKGNDLLCYKFRPFKKG